MKAQIMMIKAEITTPFFPESFPLSNDRIPHKIQMEEGQRTVESPQRSTDFQCRSVPEWHDTSALGTVLTELFSFSDYILQR